MKTRHLSDSINFTGLYFSPLLTVARWLMNCQQLPAFTRRHITLPMTLFCILNFIFKNCALILINMQNTSLVLVVLSWPVTAHGRVQDWPRWKRLGTTLAKYLVFLCVHANLFQTEFRIWKEKFIMNVISYCQYVNFLFYLI